MIQLAQLDELLAFAGAEYRGVGGNALEQALTCPMPLARSAESEACPRSAFHQLRVLLHQQLHRQDHRSA
jgi:hypothetical protein